ncbi:MAG: ATP-binding protein [Bacteroidota bacterium]
MDKQLPVFNWSLRKAQNTEPDSFIRARIRIVYTILLFALAKALVIIGFGAAQVQGQLMARAVGALVIYSVLLKLLLYRPSLVKKIAHFMIVLGVVLVCTNVFVFTSKVNLLTIQFVFMVAVSSFYILGNRLGILYSVAAILPVVLSTFVKGNGDFNTGPSNELGSPGYEVMVVLNFISIIVAHYLFFSAFNANIREKEKLNAQLQTAIADANALAVSKSNFLSTMSHELRTPLNSVIGVAELLIDDKPEERQLEYLKVLQFSALDLLSLINNVLDFNKLDSDKSALETLPVPLAELMRNLCSGLRLKATAKDLGLVLDIDPHLQAISVISDPTRLSQVIYNLVGNAIKFTEKGSVTLQLSLAKRTENEATVLFSVADTGIGIHPGKHEAIFELFSQAEAHTTREYGGTGLGLAIVKQILALFDSRIQLESSVGSGSRFFFTVDFPVVRNELAVPVVAPGIGISHLKILVAEDNEINRLVISKQMGRLNLQPVIVENGRDAYEALIAGQFDVVFMDLHMPVLDGRKTLQQIRALPDPAKANVHVVAFTASVSEQQQPVYSGFDDFLYKPLNLEELKSKLERIATSRSIPV